MLFFDWLMEPVAVKLGYWQWINGEIPFFNYVSWFIISIILLSVFQHSKFSKHNKFAVNLLLIQLMFFLLLKKPEITYSKSFLIMLITIWVTSSYSAACRADPRWYFPVSIFWCILGWVILFFTLLLVLLLRSILQSFFNFLIYFYFLIFYFTMTCDTLFSACSVTLLIASLHVSCYALAVNVILLSITWFWRRFVW